MLLELLFVWTVVIPVVVVLAAIVRATFREWRAVHRHRRPVRPI
jgi:hypothetical protein